MAAWINALREEGTKQDCLNQAIKLWEENLKLRAALQWIHESALYAVAWGEKAHRQLVEECCRAALEGKE